MDINAFLDFTLLNSTTTERDIVNLCNDALNNNYHSVCVNSCYVPLAKQLLDKTPVKICTVVGFPLGAMSTQSKAFEAKKAVENGADEIEMVINIGFLKSKNYLALLKDIIDVKIAIDNKPLKVIIEISELSKNEIIKACEISMDAKADYIKTSTGFSNSGATFTAVKIIKKTVKDDLKIVASGGINNFETALKYINLGVDRIAATTEIKITKAQLVTEIS
ncbi:deoxyribose-phosphate aldolase [Gaetbulibacter sp. M235]|uniref:deoxyribose-phosphate aldolase n=1 Tax=Gaetbulibacter sp. M235 TaxID=3126510 RepID=UPI00374FB49E